MLSDAHTSFSAWVIILVFCVGALIIATEYSQERLAAFLHKHYRVGTHRYLEWVTMDTLQLQRLAHEGVGGADWYGAAESVPYTGLGGSLAVLNIQDVSHPTLSTSSTSERLFDEGGRTTLQNSIIDATTMV